MISLFRRVMALYSELLPQEGKRWLMFAVVGSVVVAGLDMVGVAATLPLMLLATGSSDGQKVLDFLERLGVHGTGAALTSLAVAIAGLFIVKSVLTIAFRYWAVGRTQRLNALASTVLLRKYAFSPYKVHRTREAADMHWQINGSIGQVFNGVLGGFITLAVDILTLAFTLFALLLVSPWGTLVALLVFGGTVLLTQLVLRKQQVAAGIKVTEFSKSAYAALLPIIDGFREVRLSRAEDSYVSSFRRGRIGAGRLGRNLTVLNEMPRYFLEISLIVAIGLIAAVLTFTGGQNNIVAVLGVFTAAAARLVPTLQRLATTLGTIRSSQVGVNQIESLLPTFVDSRTELTECKAQPDQLVGDIELKGVSFKYPDANDYAVRDVTVRVPKGESIAFVGSSGAGKSTLLDVILGLFDPTSGAVLSNGHPIHESLDSWYQVIGVVSQDVYLANDTLRANIAFGQDPSTVNDEEILDAVRRAQLDGLLESLPDGLDTRLGERGVRVSGGQKQRIGIARALYRKPSVLILDEATSALDNVTEKRITETIESLAGELTIVLVAHRLSTIRNAHSIVFMEGGSVASTGTFDELTRNNAHFAELVRLGRLQ